jgi:hypothetical protein
MKKMSTERTTIKITSFFKKNKNKNNKENKALDKEQHQQHWNVVNPNLFRFKQKKYARRSRIHLKHLILLKVNINFFCLLPSLKV